jgi:hypothetical protein
MIELKIIDGNRAELERKLIEALCVGSPEEVERLGNKLNTLPQPDLRLAWDNQQ